MHAPKCAADNNMIEVAADVLLRVRERRPRVHCITNTVAQPFTANMLLALGAVPSMTIAPEEIASFAVRSDALLVNLGTLDAERRDACNIAISEAAASAVPWVLDPVFVDRSEPRAAFAKALLARGPHAIRLNAAEFATLAGLDPEADAIARFAGEVGAVVAVTGANDVVEDGMRRAVVTNGDALMAKVTAMGCAASAIVAACLAVEHDRWRACVAGLILLGVAGEVAAIRAQGPGSLAVEIIDALFKLDRAALQQRARVTQ
jgi:hydroxyethylthiazole kinase